MLQYAWGSDGRSVVLDGMEGEEEIRSNQRNYMDRMKVDDYER